MIYREFLVMRKALAWYAGIVILLGLMDVFTEHKGVTDVAYSDVAVVAGAFAAAFAWIFGVALGNGSRQPARVLWVLPAERWKLALQIIAVDLTATTVAFAFVYILDILPIHAPGVRVQFTGTPGSWVAASIALAYATYGWGALVGMAGRRVPYSGIIATPALMIWLTLAESHATMASIFRAPIVANPFAVFNRLIAVEAYQTSHAALDPVSIALQWLGLGWEAPVLFAIAAVTCGFTVLLWQRAQVIY